MKNIELKIFIGDAGNKIIAALKKIGARRKKTLNQVDTCYNYDSARLKIREINKNNSELIFYRRPNKKSSKMSVYEIINVKKLQLKPLKFILNTVCGEKIIVKKKRDLWKYKNTRIHLDRVARLGNFLELETVISRINRRQAEKEHKEIIKMLNILKYKKYSKSYSDLLLRG